MQNKKANEFSPISHYFHETNVMMNIFATFVCLFWLVSYLSLYLHVSFILYNTMERETKCQHLPSLLNCKGAFEDRENQRGQ